MRTCARVGVSVLRTVLLVSALFYLGAEGVCRTTPLNDLEQLVLDKHNEFRARHQDTPSLCYAEITGEDITFAAQEWADHVGNTGEFKHTGNPKSFGENMAWSSYRGEDPDPGSFYLDATERWYNEINDWDFALGKGNGVTTHFTQLVWKSTTQLNCGFATSETLHRAYVVCQYWPKGNWIKASEYPTEVHPLKGSQDEGDDELDSEEDSEEDSGEDPEEDPGEDSEEDSEEDPGEDSEEDSEEDPEEDSGEDPEEDSGEDSEEDSEEDPEEDSKEVSEGDSEEDSEADNEDNTSEEQSDSESNIIEGPESLVISQDFTTCNCWTPGCGYCSDMECTVKQDLVNSDKGIAVRSVVKRKKYNSIILYDDDGNEIGKFQWSKRAIFLSGCIACVTPKALKGKCIKAVQTLWVVSITNGVLQIRIGGEVLYENKLKGECLEKYSKAKRFAFYGMPDENSFVFVPDEMEAGDKIVSTGCA